MHHKRAATTTAAAASLAATLALVAAALRSVAATVSLVTAAGVAAGSITVAVAAQGERIRRSVIRWSDGNGGGGAAFMAHGCWKGCFGMKDALDVYSEVGGLDFRVSR